MITRVMRGLMLLIAVVSVLSACASADKQWYKPGTEYTVTEFRRDRTVCEKNGKLDEECLRQKGWVPLSTDAEKAAPVNPNANQRGRYY
jgi:hypothetical protein